MNEKHYHLHKEWILTSTDQEKTLAQKHNDILERYNKSSKELPEIPFGSKVLIHEPSNRGIYQWERSGTVTELLPNRQYKIMCNRSGKIIIRNRLFIKLADNQIRSPIISPKHQILSQQNQQLTNPPEQNDTPLLDPELPHTPQPENIEITQPITNVQKILHALKCLYDLYNLKERFFKTLCIFYKLDRCS